MRTDFLDKFIILLLIIILPLSIFIASNYQKKIEESRRAQLEQEKMKMATEAFNQLKAQQEKNPAKIDIEQVYYATESGKLVITGRAPKSDSTIMVSAVLTTRDLEKIKTASSSTKTKAQNVLGQAVDVVAVKSDSDGSFTFVKKIDSKEASVIDIRLDQDQNSATVQFDLVNNRQIN